MGDAAHAFPPIGAQGLNLGLRDISDLLTCLDDSLDAGSAEATQRYQALRLKDISTRSLGVDMLNRSLLSPYLPVDFARGAGLLALASIGPLRQFVMRQGIGR
jgi:2-octaprenyl-6-methoxyphenol hydroxylase